MRLGPFQGDFQKRIPGIISIVCTRTSKSRGGKQGGDFVTPPERCCTVHSMLPREFQTARRFFSSVYIEATQETEVNLEELGVKIR